jgi:hypothetical protein
MSKSKTKRKVKRALRAGKPRKSSTKPANKAKRATENPGSRLIDKRIRSPKDWRAETLAKVRRLILDVDPDIVEERKWVKPTNPSGVPVWSHAGIVCTGEVYKQVVKLTFARGASLPDPRRLFNSSLEGTTRRAIDIREGEELDSEAFGALIQAAVAENLRTSAPKSKSPQGRAGKSLKLLSGGNPQIAKGDGDAPVQAYIAAMPGWKSDLGKRLDALIERTVPNVRKAVKWNSPFYGLEGQGWFLSFHVFTHYVKVSFFRGTSLRPLLPGGTERSKEARWIDIREEDQFDEEQMATWVKQAAALPGWVP